MDKGLAASSELSMRHVFQAFCTLKSFQAGRVTCKHILEFIMETRARCAESNLLKISHIWTIFSKEITHWPDACQRREELTGTSNSVLPQLKWIH